MGMFDWVGDAAKSVVHGVEAASDWASGLADDVDHWFSDLFNGDVGTQAMSVPDVVKEVTASRGATDWHSGASTATELASDHQAVATQIQSISSGLESVWTGSGADAAQAKLKPLGDVADSAARTFNANSTHVAGIASGFDEMKRSLTPVPASRPDKDFWDVVTPWDTDTEDQVNQYNAQIQENLDRYNAYAQQAQDAGRQLSTDYGQLGTFDGDVTLASDSTTSATNHPTSNTASTTGSPVARLDVAPATPPHSGGVVTPVMASAGDSSSAERPSGSLPGDSTTSSAFSPLAPTPTSVGTTSVAIPSGGGPSPTVEGLGGLGLGVAGGFSGAGGGGGSSGSFGRGGGVGGGGSEGGQPGVGSRTGVGPRSVPGTAAAAEKTGPTGRGGIGTLGAAGTGAGRGKGEEDKEHNRKYGLEDDALFVDRGERLVDPETGMYVTPPTIGD